MEWEREFSFLRRIVPKPFQISEEYFYKQNGTKKLHRLVHITVRTSWYGMSKMCPQGASRLFSRHDNCIKIIIEGLVLCRMRCYLNHIMTCKNMLAVSDSHYKTHPNSSNLCLNNMQHANTFMFILENKKLTTSLYPPFPLGQMCVRVLVCRVL